jgi:Probable addiction module antidote protein
MRKTAPRSKAVGKARITRRNAKLKTIPWDVTKYLKSEADIANYLEAAFEEGDPTLVAAAFGDVARAKASRKSRTKPATRA